MVGHPEGGIALENITLKGRTAVVTGGAGGIGSAICHELDALDARVVVVDLDVEGTRAVAFSMRNGIPLAADLAIPQSIEVLGQELMACGGVDVLVNGAGWDRREPFVDSRPETWDRILAINLRAAIQLTHVVLPSMLERGWGRVLFVSSEAGRVGSSGEAVYSAAKSGLLGFAKALARESASRGVTANVVCPGPTDTPMLHDVAAGSARFLDAVMRAIPLGRLAQPSDVAGIVAYLATPRADYITGQTVSVSGGLTMV
jgi:2-hydroxycyclohexanecarboxyl-CoA dehydrogenase